VDDIQLILMVLKKSAKDIKMNNNNRLFTLKKPPHFPRILVALMLGAAGNSWANDGDAVALTDMPLTELMQIEVSSVSRKSQTLSQTAAAAFVITQEDIHRSGAMSIPEALRLAPGLDVAQIDASSWAITSRGFNGRYANKLLVLMDGRTVYTPLFSGVFWDLQDTMMEDIDHIEVIRGPGAAMWGSNAVNGVINIITKKAKDTYGNLLVAGGGSQQRGFAGFRHGGQLGNNGNYRVYGKGFERHDTVSAGGQNQNDSWRSGQFGFRMDQSISSNGKVTLQGDAYRLNVGTPFRSNAVLTPPYTSYIPQDNLASGGNVLARWENTFSNGSEIKLQGYYDRVQFDAPALSSAIDTFDIDFQHRLHLSAMHDVMWGANYRHIRSASGNSTDISYAPDTINYQNASIFAQDEIALVAERLRLTLGAKVEKSHFGGTQFQPNARLLWTPDSINSVWFAVSKASRIPSQGEASSTIALGVTPPSALTLGLPVQATISGNPNLAAEKVIAFELGYRAQWSPRFSSDIATFINSYSNLGQFVFVGGIPTPKLAMTPIPHLAVPLSYANAAETTKTYGVELSTNWRLMDWMRLEGMFTYLEVEAPPKNGVNDAIAIPRTHEMLRCLLDLSEKSKLDFIVRHVGSLPSTSQRVAAYTAVDARFSYQLHKDLELSLVGQNLFDKRHAEFASAATTLVVPPSQIPRGIYAKVIWNF
jgi:iron complex outermembrane receptor protein